VVEVGQRVRFQHLFVYDRGRASRRQRIRCLTGRSNCHCGQRGHIIITSWVLVRQWGRIILMMLTRGLYARAIRRRLVIFDLNRRMHTAILDFEIHVLLVELVVRVIETHTIQIHSLVFIFVNVLLSIVPSIVYGHLCDICIISARVITSVISFKTSIVFRVYGGHFHDAAGGAIAIVRRVEVFLLIEAIQRVLSDLLDTGCRGIATRRIYGRVRVERATVRTFRVA
jgi:hypothetical protein